MSRAGVALALAFTGVLCVPAPALAAGGLNLTPDSKLVAINLTVFVLLIYPVNKLLLGPLVNVLREREARSLGAVQRTGEVTTEIGRVRDDVEQKLADARAVAQAKRATILAEAHDREHALTTTARTEAMASVEQMRATLETELVDARGGLRQDAEALAREAASRILDRSVA